MLYGARLLDYIEPDYVHVLQDVKIIQSGDKTLAAELERRGYGTFADHIDGDGPDAASLTNSSPLAGAGRVGA